LDDSTLVLGADGGGTKTIGLIADRSAAPLARVQVGPSNQNVIGSEGAADNLAQLIMELVRESGRPAEKIACGVLGLAGAGSEAERESLIEAIHVRLQRDGLPRIPLAIKSDARIALEGAFDGGSGVVVIAGTGSIVIAKSPSGETLRVGGWGRVLGDEGSGYWIGLQALRALTLELDGRGESGRLRLIVSSRFALDTRTRIIAAIYREKFDIPSLARAVLEAAEARDAVALGILSRGAGALSAQVASAINRLGLRERVGIVMIGGLVDHDTVYARMLAAEIRKTSPRVEIRMPTHGPVHGAILIALARAKGD